MDTFAKRYCWGRWAELALVTGNPALTLDIANKLMLSTTFLPADHVASSIWRLRAMAHVALGELATAELLLHEAQHKAEADDEQFILWRICADLGRLYYQMARPEEAEMIFKQARGLVDNLAADIPDEAIRAEFAGRAQSLLTPP